MASRYAVAPLDLSKLETYPLASRKSKVSARQIGKPAVSGGSFRDFWEGLPDILAGRDLRDLVSRLERAREGKRAILWGLGAHVIKVGLSPLLVDLMERGYVQGIALNGAGIIHDFEIALSGGTSEDVDESLGAGRFGMAAETAQLNDVVRRGAEAGQGIGQAVGAHLAALDPPFRRHSLTATAHRLGIPLTVHVALGTDILHMHPAASGAAIGEASLRDFRYFTSCVARLGGGVYLNCGSAVVLPEVFLKAVALSRNQGADLTGLTTINIDFIRQYRPQTNVVTRPVAGSGTGISLVGHHEILIPLLAAAVIESAQGADQAGGQVGR
jgi:hypothetical protein